MWRYLAALALVGSACAGGSDDGDGFGDFMAADDESPPSSFASGSATTEAPPAEDSDLTSTGDSGVPPLTCGALLTTEDAEFALDVWERDDGPLQTIRYVQGEACIESARDDEATYVKIEPGTSTDFAHDARLLDADPRAVNDGLDIADEVRWFAGQGEGLLSVARATELGELRFRLGLGRPELTDDGRLDVALELARRVLPNFPGVPRPEPPVIQLEDPDVDRSAESYVDHLFAREAAGEWGRGEGLVELLSVLAGETPATVALVEIPPSSAAPVLGLARDYVAANPSGDHATEIERLVDELTFHRDEFAATGAIQGFRRPTAVEPCTPWFDSDVCVAKHFSADLDDAFGVGKYQVFGPAPAPPGEIAGWTESKIARVVDAVEESAMVLEELGTMPQIDVMITPLDAGVPALSYGDAEDCLISVNPPIQPYNNFQFKQWIAGEMAHCFNGATFANQYTGGYERNLWWSAGLSIYLSNVIYPDANLEWKHLPASLAQHELTTSIFGRSATNGMFFQHLEPSYSVDGIIAFIQNLPSGGGDQAAAVADWPSIGEILHEYLHLLSDRGVPDSGSTSTAGMYKASWTDFGVASPMSIERQVDAFEVERIWMIVEAGKYACMDYDPTGGMLFSWREGDPGQQGVWSYDPPDVVRRFVVFAASSTKDGQVVRITVDDVVDDPDDCDEDPDDDGSTGQLPECPAVCGPSEYYG